MDCSTPGLPSIISSWSLSKIMSIESVMPTISSSVVPFSSRLQSFPASGSFSMSQFFASGGQRIGVSASTSVLPINIQDWFPLGGTGWISLQSKSRVFSITRDQKQQLFGAQLSLWSNSHIHRGPLYLSKQLLYLKKIFFYLKKVLYLKKDYCTWVSNYCTYKIFFF